MQQETKAMIVKRPSDGEPYVLFTKTIVTDNTVAVIVTAAVHAVMVPGCKLPLPIELSPEETVELVRECDLQVKKYAQELNDRYENKHGR